MEAGTYAYRVVWDGGQGNLLGLDFSGDKAIATTVPRPSIGPFNYKSAGYRHTRSSSIAPTPRAADRISSSALSATAVKDRLSMSRRDTDRNGTQLTQVFPAGGDHESGV